MKHNITVGICTWNRAKSLDATLQAIQKLDIPAQVEWEVLVVNNNSTDHTEEVIRSYETALPIRGVFEPLQGKSHALNRAVRESKGDYILWTDDDALVASDWVASYVEAFQVWPTASVFGGPVRPHFIGSPPTWLLRVIDRVNFAYALIDYGSEMIELSATVVPFGVNMAVRRREQLRYQFDPDLGPRPGSQLRGEETQLVRKMLADGMIGRWAPNAVVEHCIPEERQTLAYLRDYYRGAGAYASLQNPDPAIPVLFGKPRWLWRQLFTNELKYRIGRRYQEPKVWMDAFIAANVARGALNGCSSNTR